MQRAPYLPAAVLAADLPGSLFRAQSIVRAHDEGVFAYELLYRGEHPSKWEFVDASLLRYLATHSVSAPIFVNLSNESLRSADEALVVAVHECNDVFFEWTEVPCDDESFTRTSKRINALIGMGLRFVVDDVGAGRDGLERIMELGSVYAAKIDGRLFHKSRASRSARRLLEHLVGWCRDSGVLSIAEWVESEGDGVLARQLGFDLLQGFHIHHGVALSCLNTTVRASLCR